MKLDQFITTVLNDIDSGLKQARERTHRKYYVDARDNKGVTFDIAVTTVNSSGTEAKGTAKAGFVEVLGAQVGATLEDKKENSQVSRIQFTVYVPDQTVEEEQESEVRFRQQNRNEIEGLDPY
jgi:hypothetical protein